MIPTNVQLPFPAVHGFWLYDEKLVLVNTVSAELVIKDKDDIELYGRLFERLWEVAKHGEEATAVVRRVVGEVAGPTEARY